MARNASGEVGRLMGTLAVFFIFGAPLVAYIWHTLNVLLTGRIEPLRLLLLLPVLLAFWLVLRWLDRTVHRIDAEHAARTGRIEPPPA